MSEGKQNYQIFRREYYWSPAYHFFDNPYYGREKWVNLSDINHENKKIGKVMATTETYFWESGNDYDKIPTYMTLREFIYHGMKLKYSKQPGEWLNQYNEIVCFDASVKHGSNPCLLIRKDDFIQYLKQEKLNIIWTWLGQKQIIGKINIVGPSWLELSGTLYFQNDKIEGNIRPIIV